MRELYPWYAITVKHQHEQAVRFALTFKGFAALAPTYRARRRWSDRVRELDLPLFAGYVFCQFPFPERAQVLDTPGVAKVVEFGGNAGEISAEEIAAIQTVMASKLPVRPWPHLKPGTARAVSSACESESHAGASRARDRNGELVLRSGQVLDRHRWKQPTWSARESSS